MSCRHRAFTVVELLVVVAIILLLLSILLPSVDRMIQVSELTVCGSNQKQLGAATFSYVSDNFGEVMTHNPHTITSNLDHVWQARNMASEHDNFKHWAGSGKLWQDGYIGTTVAGPQVAFCPSMQAPPLTYKFYLDGKGRFGYLDDAWDGPLVNNDFIRSSYGWNPHEEDAKPRDIKYRRLTQFAPDDEIFIDTLESYKNSSHQPLQRINLTYSDGAVISMDTTEVVELWAGFGSLSWSQYRTLLKTMRATQ